MPSVAAFAAALGKAGVGPDTRVVAYTTTTPMWATRLWWMLRASGFDNAAVLDGGFAKWKAEGRDIESGTHSYAPTTLSLTARPDHWADKDAVLAAIEDGAVCTLNALSPELHAGTSKMNYGRKGRIAGSRNVYYANLLKEDGTFRDAAELRPHYDGVGAFERERVICYCGGGISATMNALALTRLGHPSVAVYDGSMAEWTRDPELPMETDG
jgi:thiosulfate/3-mercaptopyruvate sulfurtransferase